MQRLWRSMSIIQRIRFVGNAIIHIVRYDAAAMESRNGSHRWEIMLAHVNSDCTCGLWVSLFRVEAYYERRNADQSQQKQYGVDMWNAMWYVRYDRNSANNLWKVPHSYPTSMLSSSHIFVPSIIIPNRMLDYIMYHHINSHVRALPKPQMCVAFRRLVSVDLDSRFGFRHPVGRETGFCCLPHKSCQFCCIALWLWLPYRSPPRWFYVFLGFCVFCARCLVGYDPKTGTGNAECVDIETTFTRNCSRFFRVIHSIVYYESCGIS